MPSPGERFLLRCRRAGHHVPYHDRALRIGLLRGDRNERDLDREAARDGRGRPAACVDRGSCVHPVEHDKSFVRVIVVLVD